MNRFILECNLLTFSLETYPNPLDTTAVCLTYEVLIVVIVSVGLQRSGKCTCKVGWIGDDCSECKR